MDGKTERRIFISRSGNVARRILPCNYALSACLSQLSSLTDFFFVCVSPFIIFCFSLSLLVFVPAARIAGELFIPDYKNSNLGFRSFLLMELVCSVG